MGSLSFQKRASRVLSRDSGLVSSALFGWYIFIYGIQSLQKRSLPRLLYGLLETIRGY